MAEELDLGSDCSMRFVSYQGERSGITFKHPGCPAPSWLPFAGRAWAKGFSGKLEAWTVEKDDPLTLSPSIQCRACGIHGYIRNGKWEKA